MCQGPYYLRVFTIRPIIRCSLFMSPLHSISMHASPTIRREMGCQQLKSETQLQMKEPLQLQEN